MIVPYLLKLLFKEEFLIVTQPRRAELFGSVYLVSPSDWQNVLSSSQEQIQTNDLLVIKWSVMFYSVLVGAGLWRGRGSPPCPLHSRDPVIF